MTEFLWKNLFKKEKNADSIQAKLKANVLFQDLNFSELSFVEKIVHLRNYHTGEIIFRQSEVGVGMYIISKGSVNIYVEEVEPKTGEIKSNHVTQLKEGDFFGDLALVEDNGRRSASAIANEDCVLIGFFKPDLMEVANRNPSAGVKILLRLGEVLGARLVETTAKISELKKAAK